MGGGPCNADTLGMSGYVTLGFIQHSGYPLEYFCQISLDIPGVLLNELGNYSQFQGKFRLTGDTRILQDFFRELNLLLKR